MIHPEKPWSCDAVSERLLDLVYDELDARDAAALRAHVEGCESCERTYRRLVRGRSMARALPQHDPPPSALNAVLAAARARAAAVQHREASVSVMPQTEVQPAPAAENSGGWLAFLRGWGEFAMGPQVAMATTLLVVIGLGLWSLPKINHRHETMVETAIVEPEAAPAAQGSVGLEPAERLDLEMDPRTRRLVAREEERAEAVTSPRRAQMRRPMEGNANRERHAEFDQERFAAAEGASEPALVPVESPREPTPSPRASSSARRLSRGRGGYGEAAASAPADDRGIWGDEDALAGSSSGGTSAGRSTQASASSSAPAAARRSSAAARSDGVPPPPGPREGSAAPRRSPTPNRSAAAGTSARSQPESTAAEESALGGVATEAPSEAQAPPQADDVTDALARGLHRRARAALDDERWVQCSGLYQSLVQRYPGYPDLGQAYNELAYCERQRGRTAQAAAATRQARQYAAPRARSRASRGEDPLSGLSSEPAAATSY